MFYLTTDIIKDNIYELLCSYRDRDQNMKIIYQYDLCPQTFTVAEKIVYDKFCFDKNMYGELEKKHKNKELLYFRDVSTEAWIKGMLSDLIAKIDVYTSEERERIIECAYQNTLLLLKYKTSKGYICENIYNQEFVDILRNIMIYTIYGDLEHTIDSAKIFNDLADKIIPLVLEKIELEKFDIKYIFKMSIASGMSGLDMKGAPAASSNYANSGISMKNYLKIDLSEAIRDYYEKLCHICNTSTTPCFDWDILVEKIKTSRRLVWFTDDYIESYFDLYFIQKIMTSYPITIEIVPKNGIYGNDMSWMGLNNVVTKLNIFEKLRKFILEGRLLINKNGPKMAAINLQKLSNGLIHSLEIADFCILKGCRIHEMIQGNFNIESFSSYIVSRELSEIVTGYNSHEYPILLIHLNPGEFAYWGINGLQKKVELSDKRIISTIYSPLATHVNHKKMSNAIDVILEFEDIKGKLKCEKESKRKILQELDLLGDKLIEINRKTYNDFAHQYSDVRNKVSELDRLQWDKLGKYSFSNINGDRSQQKSLLDAGSGNGRDLLYARDLGYQVFGIDYSEEFYHMLMCLEREKKLEKNSCKCGDLRNLPWENNTFDIVRQNATLLHFPVIDFGYGVDKVVSESYRVLKPRGILYVSVKKGDGLICLDTEEGLGVRVFQLFSPDILTLILKRNGFQILSIENVEENRNGNIINWIIAIARKEE